MPTYEYECARCKKVFEQFQKITDPPLKKCPHCGSTVKRLISAGGGIIFKGSGFYETDYRSDAYKKKAQADSPGNDASKGSEACKTCPQGGTCPAQK